MADFLKDGLARGFTHDRQEIVDWAENKVYLPSSLTELHGPYRRHNAPYQIEPLQEIANDENEGVVLIKANQVGGSTVGTLALAYFIDQDPGAAMWVSGNERLIRDFSKDALFPILRNVSSIDQDVLKNRNSSGIYEVRLPSMTLLLAWGGSAALAEQKSVRLLFLDEIELYPDHVDAFERRATRRFNSRKVYMTKPKMDGGISQQKYRLTDQREWHWPCLKCGAPLPLKFKGHIFFDKFYHANGKPDWSRIFPTIRYVCQNCQYAHFESPELHAHLLDRGRYIATAPEANKGLTRKWVGFRWNAMLLPLIEGVPSWQRLVREFVEAEQTFTTTGAILPLKQFMFTRLAEWWKIGDEHDKKEVKLSDYSINDPVSADWDEIIMTVDSQETHFWFTVFGWKRDGRARLLDCGKLLTEGEILVKQDKHGIRNPHFVFVDCAWSPGRRFHKLCAQHGWTALVGTDLASFPHPSGKDAKGRPKLVYRIYSRRKLIDCGMGTKRAGRIYCKQFDFASNTAEGMLQERLDKPSLNFELPHDAPPELREHLDGVKLDKRFNKKTGRPEWYWHDIANGKIHLRDCCKMQIVAASMAKCIVIDPPTEDPLNADAPAN